MLKKILPSRLIIGWVLKHTKKRIPALIILTICRLITASIGILFAYTTKNIINAAVNGDTDFFFKSSVKLLIIIIIQIASSSYALHLQEMTSYRMDCDFKRSILRRILNCNYSEISKYHSGDLLHRLNGDVSVLISSILTICVSTVSLIVSLVLAAVAIAAIDPLFAIVIIPICVILSLATLLAQRDMKKLELNISSKSGKLSGFFQEIMENLLIVQGLNVSDSVNLKADALMKERVEVQRARKNVSLSMSIGSNILGYLGSFLTLVWCANKVLDGSMDYGTLIAMTALVGQLQGPMLSIPSVFPKLISLTASSERLMEIENIASDEEVILDRSEFNGLSSIELQNVSFSYVGNSNEVKKVMSDFSCNIVAGETTVITGPSGVGKSSLIKLLLGIYTPDSGDIIINTENGNPIPVNRSTRSLFSYAPQGNLILSGTIRDNILITNPSATEEELNNAIYVSVMEDYIKELELGLDTVLGENGKGLSEGQVQRINIARAVISGAPVLLLDEVTSSLDGETEKKVLERINALENRTCIVITHRPAALELADAEIKM